MGLFKVVCVRPYGSYSHEDWRKLSESEAKALKSELEKLNPGQVYRIEVM